MARKREYFKTRPRVLLIILVTVVVISVILYALLYTNLQLELRGGDPMSSRKEIKKGDDTFPLTFTKLPKSVEELTKLIQIVVWPFEPFFNKTKGKIPKNLKSLEKIGCTMKLSRNQEDVDGADAVLFYLFSKPVKKEELPKKSRSDQVWIVDQREPKPWQVGSHLNSLFNWTISYRKDSDIYSPYFKTFNKNSTLSPSSAIIIGKDLPLDTFIKGKSKFAVAVISSCNAKSGRDQIIKRLQSVNVSIDIFGKCGKPLNESWKNYHCDSEVFQKLAKDYKFFLAFENSICTDYITEKFWRSLEIGMVPVVLGRGDYLTDAPPNSFIDIRDYPDPIDLRNYLQRLDGNDTEFSKYFEWRKDKIEIKQHWVLGNDICQRLQERRKQCEVLCQPQVYMDFESWWKNEPGKTNSPVCVPPEEIGLEKYMK